MTGAFSLTEITPNSKVASLQPSELKFTQGVRFSASNVSSLYKDEINEIRVNSVLSLALIRAYEA
nr:MAG TPA: hypothetical protein [Caudoviricetes sp.]